MLTTASIEAKMNELWARNRELTTQQHAAQNPYNPVLIDFLSCEIAGNILWINGLGECINIHQKAGNL